jgi:pyroglutamyl-peptidase
VKRKILVTGFEPFGGDEVNPSGDIAKSLDGFEVAGHRVVSAIMPVEWGTVQSRLESLIDEVEPAVVLSLGLSAGRAEISVEKVAVNYTSKSKDNAGVIPVGRPIIQGAPDGYFATIPVEDAVEAIVKAGIPARLSLSAGAYLCNYAFYCASHLAKQRGGVPKVGFIHIPATPEMAAGRPRGVQSMSIDLQRRAVQEVLTISATAFQNVGTKEGI